MDLRTRRGLKLIGAVLAAATLAIVTYGAIGYLDALRDAPALRTRADRLIAGGRGADALGSGRIHQLLRVEDPGFWKHRGVDISTPGAGLTSVTQSLSKRLAFDHFRPGLGKIRQTTYALGLEQRLSKPQILALYLDTVEMGQGPAGWMKGFFDASVRIYGCSANMLSDRQFLSLVAVMVAPARFDLRKRDVRLASRVDRIERLLSGRCQPRGERDVWLEGCA